jgi:hypothetical protein
MWWIGREVRMDMYTDLPARKNYNTAVVLMCV